MAKAVNLRDFCYANFGWIGQRFAILFPKIERDLDAAYMKIHPEVYFSIFGFIILLTIPLSLTLSVLFWLLELPLFIPFTAMIPIIGIVLSLIIPKLLASNRISGLKVEIPYASMYISVMTSGGISPYESLLRMHRMDLLPNMQKEVSRIKTIVTSTGVDPISAMEQAAKVVTMSEYKELLLGYASTVRTGGDTMHYLFNQTKSMFRRLSTRIKSMGEIIGTLMEAYIIIGVLGVLGLFLIFVIGFALPAARMNISSEQFFFFSFIGLPAISIGFIYLSDAVQISYPISNWKPYLYFAAALPLGFLLGSQMFLSFFTDSVLFFPPLQNLVISIRGLLNLAEGTEAALGLTITLIIVALPPLIADYRYTREDKSLQQGITNFLRDLVETRKSGLTPERCIESLSKRDYKGFSKHLRKISAKISWGYPIRRIYDDFREKVKNWLSLVNVYLLIDTIEVGGGTEESLETLAEFSESSKALEEEKRATLMPLTFVPYIGGALLTGSVVMFLNFLTGFSKWGVSASFVLLYRSLLPPLVLHSFILGLVTGKIGSGRVSAGFKHAIIMVLVAILGIWVVSNLNLSSF